MSGSTIPIKGKSQEQRELDAYWAKEINNQLRRQKEEERERMTKEIIAKTTCAKCGQSNDYHLEDVCKETVELEEAGGTQEPHFDYEETILKMMQEMTMKEDEAKKQQKPAADTLVCYTCGQNMDKHDKELCEEKVREQNPFQTHEKKPDPSSYVPTRRAVPKHPVVRGAKKNKPRQKKKK